MYQPPDHETENMVQKIIILLLLFSISGCDTSVSKKMDGRKEGSHQSPDSQPQFKANVSMTPDDVSLAREKQVVLFTASAANKVQIAQRRAGDPYIRVRVEFGGSTGFMYDLQTEDTIDPEVDYVHKQHGLIIVVDEKSALLIQDSTIDWVTTENGRSGFKFDNPNAVDPGEADD